MPKKGLLSVDQAISAIVKKILRLKKEGKQPMKSEEFLKGNKLKIGTNLISDV